MFRQNTAAFHDLRTWRCRTSRETATTSGCRCSRAPDREKQLALVQQFTDLVAASAGDALLSGRTWVLLTEAVDGGSGLAGHANTNAELIVAARAQIAELGA